MIVQNAALGFVFGVLAYNGLLKVIMNWKDGSKVGASLYLIAIIILVLVYLYIIGVF